MAKFQPMLCATAELKDLPGLPWPMVGSYKYDGFRAVVDQRGRLLSRKLKPIKNKALQKKFGGDAFVGLDGELIYGDPTAENCFNVTSKIVTTRDAPADGVKFYVFDHWIGPSIPYRSRRANIALCKWPKDLVLIPQQMLHNPKQAMEFEEAAVRKGYEGVIFRALDAPYKFGRSTLPQGWLVKLKRFVDIEVEVLEIYPRKKNNNKLERDERGYAKRSSHKANKVELEEVGGFKVRSLKNKWVFKMGPGILTQDERRRLWKKRGLFKGRVAAKCRYQPAGMKDKPRFGRFVGWRSRLDF